MMNNSSRDKYLQDVPEAAAKAADEPAETATPVEADKPAGMFHLLHT